MRTLGDPFRRRGSSIARTGATRPSPVSPLTNLNLLATSSNWNRRTDQRDHAVKAMTAVRPRPAARRTWHRSGDGPSFIRQKLRPFPGPRPGANRAEGSGWTLQGEALAGHGHVAPVPVVNQIRAYR